MTPVVTVERNICMRKNRYRRAVPKIVRLTRPAQWMDTVTQMLQDGCGEFYECGPLGHLRVHPSREQVATQARFSLIWI